MKIILILIMTMICGISYSKENVNIFYPFSSGSATDVLLRKNIENLNNEKYTFNIIPTPGAAGLLAINAMKNSKKNSVAVIGNSILSFNNLDLEKDIKMISFLGYEPTLIVVNSKSPYQNVDDLHKYSSNKQITYGSSGVGSYGHFSSSIISNNNKNFTHIPYKNTGLAVPDLIAGRIDFLVMDEFLFRRMSSNNELRAIAVNFNNRLKTFPDIKTLKEQNIDNHSFYRWEIIVSDPEINKDILKHIVNYFSSDRFLKENENIPFFNEKDKNNFLNYQKQLLNKVEAMYVN